MSGRTPKTVKGKSFIDPMAYTDRSKKKKEMKKKGKAIKTPEIVPVFEKEPKDVLTPEGSPTKDGFIVNNNSNNEVETE